ncbi:MAG TPA: DnaD domain protein [Cerasibacillus sp.]|uniref:replication initiation and membrane attachment family protein n=1 Tax=Cerasibacillus sp. TaxID=2498711 RepID=UPI002F3FF27D
MDYAISLTHLYQPLIGIHAVMLYQTLLHDVSIFPKKEFKTHHQLMSCMGLPLDEIYQARLKLEAIGLMNTYEIDDESYTVLSYDLIGPFSPKQFFQDAMLSQLLYHQIGKYRFDQLQAHFVKEETMHGKKITASFETVFKTLRVTNSPIQPKQPVAKKQLGPNVQEIDFNWLAHVLKKQMIPAERVLTKTNQRIISQMKILYDLANHEIEKCVLWAITEDHTLNVEEFKQACHDAFTMNKKHQTVELVAQDKGGVDSHQKQSQLREPKTKEEKLVQILETISPQQLLADLSSGNQASEQDLTLVRDIMLSQGLPSPVMNVLIHYVLLQSDMRLSRKYMETIASHWSRANLKTAKEAMAFAKKQQNQFEKRRTNQPTQSYYKQQKSADVIPDWFKKRQKNQETKQPSTGPVIDVQKEKEKMAAFIKQHAMNQHK